tara:strand:- start:20065 stop:20574 length:510 start_codon:yes stop_codon:yes gene_type:complete
MKKQGLIVALCLLVSACGFEPMYGTAFETEGGAQSTIQSELGQVEIGNIPDREGQFLRNALIDRFYKNGRPADAHYSLEIAPIQQSTSDLDITIRSDATRRQLVLSSTLALKDKATGETLLTRNIKSSGSYNVLISEFATRVSEQNTRENGLNDLARQIELQIGLYLKR